MAAGAVRVRAVSDLHMFCRRSRWESVMGAIDSAASVADLFVFNGDTLDFKWTQLGSVEDTALAGESFFDGFLGRHPACRVHVNLGNHDHHRLFVAALDRLSDRHARFSWEPYLFRLGNAVFLHGDAAHFGADHGRLEHYRAGWHERTPAGRRLNLVHDWGFRARLHHVVPALVFPHRRTLKRLSAYLDACRCSAKDGVDTVCFGHVHRPVDAALYRGQQFYTCGAALRGLSFRILEFDLSGETAGCF